MLITDIHHILYVNNSHSVVRIHKMLAAVTCQEKYHTPQSVLKSNSVKMNDMIILYLYEIS